MLGKQLRGVTARAAILCAVLACSPALAADLTGIAVQTQGDAAQLILAFTPADEGFAASQFAMAAPGRIVLDFKGTVMRAGPVQGTSALVRSVRASQFSPEASRVVIDLVQSATVESAVWGEDGQLIVTLAPVGEKAFASAARAGRKSIALPDKQAAAAPEPARPVEVAARAETDSKTPSGARAEGKAETGPPVDDTPADGKLTESRPQKTRIAQAAQQPRVNRIAGRKPVVVIDAGHGGADPGAPSVLDGKTEKTVTLEIAKAIKAELDRSGQVKAVLTRDKDFFIPLQERVAIARRLKADLFISVHADSIANPDIRGATVYTLSERASDREAERLAAKENRADMIAGINFDTRTPDVADILLSLMQRETMNYSAEFAATTVDAMGDDIFFRTNHHRFAGFMVLKAPDIPSVLLETGYMSNLEDSRFLFSEEGQKKLARGVREAVERYFARRTGKATASAK